MNEHVQDPDALRARRRRRGRRITAVAAAGCATVALAACGSSKNSSSSTSSPAASGSGTTSTASASSGGGTQAAQKAIAPYVGHPSPFPVNTPLGGKLPAGTTAVLLEPTVSAGALVAGLLKPALAELGVQLKLVNAGTTASTAQAAASSALSLHPKIVFTTAVTPSEYGGGLKQIAATGAKVISLAVAGPTKQYGITFGYIGESALQESGRLMADWIIAHKGSKANIVFYGVPEIAFTPYMEAAFKQELAKNCSTCKVRFKSIDITTLGQTSSSTVVNDLQSHPSTNYAVYEVNQEEDGVLAAMKTAGISVPGLIYAPEPEELQDIKSSHGVMDGLGVDLATQVWAGADIAARLVLHKPLTPLEISGVGPLEFLTSQNDTFSPTRGWSGYPDFAQRFQKLWNAK